MPGRGAATGRARIPDGGELKRSRRMERRFYGFSHYRHRDKIVQGMTLSAYLTQELNAHIVASPAAAALLNPVLTGNYEVVIKENAPTATSGTRVTINPKETKIATANTLNDLKEFVGSTILELT